ncbi:SHOCT domain-containing protein [Aquincola sp. J276]|uniref:SHOCT domain-containing protein n=1 Tax=Aquincola sp. J276 TaxID=2898432 RepID=UPI002151104F|nr:SHOCT domain-containing protein [Aquincola sp. J276]MCR5867407.1 SHOCT domain-containing protein [Aquincola sp. J276]
MHRPIARGTAAFACTAALLAATGPAQAGVFDTLFGRSTAAASEQAAPSSKPGRRHWQLAEFTELRLEPRETSAALNEHPQVIPAAVLRQWMQGVVLQRGTQREPLFGTDELASLPAVIADALAVASPQDDLLLLSTSRRDGGLLGTPYGITARLFVQGGALQLLVQEARLDFYNQYRGARILPEFRFGSRGAAGAVKVSSPEATGVRADWLAFALGTPAAVAAPAPAGVTPAAAAAAVSPAAAPVAPAGAAAAAPRPAVQPVPVSRDARFYEEQEQRLRSLKRLRDQNLLTEEEYQAKRKEILQAL